MLYEFELQDSAFQVDTRCLNYELIWRKLRLNKKQRNEAQKIIELYNSTIFRHQADHYKTRSELEISAGGPQTVTKLIDASVLEIHRKWEPHLIPLRQEDDGRVVIEAWHHKRHPQAPYRLNVWKLCLLAEVVSQGD